MATVRIQGGDRLEQALRDIAARLGNAKSVDIGFLEGATYPATGEDDKEKSVPMIAAIMEYGAPAAGVPSRPFFRNMIADKSPKWAPSVGRLLVLHAYDVNKVLHLMGEGIKGQLQESIRTFDGVPLKPATIARKGFDKQLINTNVMMRAVDYEVHE